ncbi:septum formation family protein [Arthrobacter oryzae]|uniref:septum formation family protein n=1 Tax=Arthrobacter oryzae TaxID=409290 RepID=UPI00273C5B51|nr:septum formation family protein [Arthrobacter oryzae]WLQ07639.1 septum formation family protein [Arthrobacter oryzae]
MKDQNATGTSAGEQKASPGPGTPPVVPPPPARPPTSSLPVQPPAAADKPPAAADKPAPAGKPAPATVTGRAAPDADERKQTLSKVAFVAGGLVLLGLVIWWLATLIASGNEQAAQQPPAPTSAGTAPVSPSPQATRSQLPMDGVGALDYQLGDCFENFDPEATESRVVACTSGHSAQLVAVHRYPESDSYPGIAALRQKGREICQGAGLTDAVANYVLMQRNAYPSDTSWAQGDRRVDCYVTADKGNIIMESLIP